MPSHYTKEQQKYSDYLNIKSSGNKAKLSEIKEKIIMLIKHMKTLRVMIYLKYI